jgi:hypothetical protein
MLVLKIYFFMLLTVAIPLNVALAFEQSNMTSSNPKESTNMSNPAGAGMSNLSGECAGCSGAEPPDFSNANCDSSYSSTACDIVHDLISLSKDQLGGYILSDNANFVIEQALNILSPENLTKVLQNISPQELSSIKDKLTPQTFDTILSKVPQPQRNEIVNRISPPP